MKPTVNTLYNYLVEKAMESGTSAQDVLYYSQSLSILKPMLNIETLTISGQNDYAKASSVKQPKNVSDKESKKEGVEKAVNTHLKDQASIHNEIAPEDNPDRKVVLPKRTDRKVVLPKRTDRKLEVEYTDPTEKITTKKPKKRKSYLNKADVAIVVAKASKKASAQNKLENIAGSLNVAPKTLKTHIDQRQGEHRELRYVLGKELTVKSETGTIDPAAYYVRRAAS